MIEEFVKREVEYLQWVTAHPNGFVANFDLVRDRPDYPMVHIASHKLVSSPARENYTTGDYVKFCSEDLSELEGWLLRKFRRKSTHCSVCMK